MTYKVHCKGYEDFIGNAKITVFTEDAPEITFTKKPMPAKLTYNGTQQQLLTLGKAVCKTKDGTQYDAVILYAMLKGSQSIEDVSYTSVVPYATNAKDYKIAYVAYDPLTGTYAEADSLETKVEPEGYEYVKTETYEYRERRK